MMTNRPEFHLVDTAALHLGAIPFSVYNIKRHAIMAKHADVIETLYASADEQA